MKKHIISILVFFSLLACNDSKKEEKVLETAQNTATHQDTLEASITRGTEIYTNFCMQCHLANGKGMPNAFPPLANSDWLLNKRDESIHAVKFGQKGEITVNGEIYNNVMAPLGLSSQEIADVMNYVMNSWGNKQDKMVTKSDVEKIVK